MRKNAEIWYEEGSGVSALAESLRDRYRVRPFLKDSGFRREAQRGGDGENEGLESSVIPVVILAELARERSLNFEMNGRSADVQVIGIVDKGTPDEECEALVSECGNYFAVMRSGVSREHVVTTIEAALEHIDSTGQQRNITDAAEHEREELNRIGIALSSTRNVDLLLEMILAKAREISGADAGSLYIVETSGSENGLSGRPERILRFKLTQNDTRQFPYAEYTLPISEDSMAGYTALHGKVIAFDDVYHIPVDRPYRFNPSYDQETKYRTRSLLTVPMKNARGEVLGVMQLLNRKRNRGTRLLTRADIDREVEPFPDRTVHLVESLASQAAVAYENSQLYQNIENLFEGFVKAAATAIEQRDPTTSGHSARVATMTLALAEAVNRTDTGPYASVQFTTEQMKEMRYASLLHDFGKIAVREDVLVKAKRLYPAQLTIIQQRFDYWEQELETQRAQRKLAALLAAGQEGSERFAEIEEDCAFKQNDLRESFQVIVKVNGAAELSERDLSRLAAISTKTYRDRNGLKHRLLTPGELASLSVRQGSLNKEERQEIESHVVHSFNFLSQIPWTSDLRYVPWIVRAHHEKLNGKGYPYGLSGDEIPIQAKMMIICDIFDALCSADRPYKKAVPFDRAFEILETAVRQNELDPELFRIFKEERVFNLIGRTPEPARSEDEKVSDPELRLRR